MPTIAQAQADASQAHTDLSTTRTDLSNEVARAKSAEGTLTTSVTQAQGRADAAHTAITTEQTTRADADKALSDRSTALESTVNTGPNRNSALRSSINEEATTRADAVSAVAGRTTSLETRASQIPESFTAISRGYSAGVPSGRNPGLHNAAGQNVAGGGRSYLLVIYNQNSNVVGYADNFDVFGNADEAARMASVLNGLAAGRTVVITTNDEPRQNRLSNGLQAAMERCGAGALFSSPNFASRGAYVLIGRAGIGKGNGQEYYAGNVDNSPDAWLEVPFEVINGLASINGAGAAVLETNAKLSEEQTARANADSALVGRTSTLEASVNNSINSLSNLRSAITDEATARTDADSALSTRATNLEATVNTGPNRNASLRSAITDEATARTDADSALSTRSTNLEATVNTGANRNALLRSDLTTEASTRSTADSALATRATTLESTVGDSGVLNVNPNFANYPATSGAPPGWINDNQTGSNATRVAGEKGGYAVQLVGPANGQSYAGQNLSQRLEAQTYCVIEADIKLVSGTLVGAGVMFRAGGDLLLSFSQDKDATDKVVGNGSTGSIYRFRKLVQTPAAAATPVLYMMSHWGGFGVGVASATSIIWYRCAVRPASAAEIAAQKADTALNTPTTGVIARLTQEETTRATADSALVDRASALEATVNTGPNRNAQLRASISDEATARTDADSALSTRTQSLESTLNTPTTGVIARLTNEETTRATADTALATRATAIEASATNSGNLVPNTAFTTLDGWSSSGAQNGASFGRNLPDASWQIGNVENNLTIRSNNFSGIALEVYSDPFAVEANAWYQVYALTAAHRCNAWVSLFFYDYQGTFVGYAGENRNNREGAGGAYISGHDITGKMRYQAPATAVRARMVLRAYDTNFDGYAWFSRPYVGKVKANTNEWNDYVPGNDRNVIASTNAKLNEEATARTNADSAIAGRTSTLETNYNSVRGDLNQWNQDRYNEVVALQGRITNEETARTNADSALVNRASRLEATAGTQAGVIVPNSTFSIWDDGLETPNYWGWWQKSGTIERVATGRTTGGYAARITSPANSNNGIAQMYGGGPVINQGWYVLEADVQLVSGSWRGSGLTIQGIYSINFAIEADTSGAVDATYIGLRRFTKLVKVEQVGYTNWHPMDNWDGFNLPRDAKTLIWYRASLRPASDGEIKANKAFDVANDAQARITNEETARATAISAVASRTSSVEASVSQGGYLHPNSMFTREPRVGFGAPYAWGQWARDGDGYYGSWGSNGNNYGGYAIQIDRQGMNAGLQNFVTGTFPKGWYVLECEVRLEDGASAGAGFHANFNNGSYDQINFNTDPDTFGYTGAHGTGNYKFTKLIFNGDNSGAIYIYMMAGWSGFNLGYNGFLRTIWFKAGIRPATTSEVQAGKVQGIDARVTTAEGALATIDGKTQAYFEKKASVPGAEAFISAVAKNDNGVATSNVAIGGASVALYNTENGTAKRAMYLSGGNSVFDGSITANGGILVGTGKLRVQVQAQDYQVSHDQYVSFGYDLGRAPSITFGPSPVALASGEVYAPYAAELSSTGFRAKLLINAAPQSSSQSIGAFTRQGDGAFHGNRSGRPNAANGQYTLTVNLSAVGYAYSDGSDLR